MKIRRSARTILATLVVLSVFTLLTAWHNEAPNQLSEPEKQSLIKQLSLKNAKLQLLIKAMKSWDTSHGFYLVGSRNRYSWPEDIARACYFDPLAVQSMASKVKIPTSEEVDLIRYRSLEDFLNILSEAEKQKPGSLIRLNIRQYQVIQEPQFAFSLRLVISIVLGVSGLLVVRFYNR